MKRKEFFYISVILFFLISTANVYASNFKFAVTDSTGTEKTVFAFDETPYLEVLLKGQEDDIVSIVGWWKPLGGGDADKTEISEGGLTGRETILRPLSNWGWPIPQDPGQYMAHLKGYGTDHFTVTPEPFSSLLFVIGGACLAGLGYRRKEDRYVRDKD